MPVNDFNPKELKQLLDIANSIIGQLEYFNINFQLNADQVNQQIPIGLDDDQAAIFVQQNAAAQIILDNLLLLANEPMIGCIKLIENSEEIIYLVTRGYTPADYHPKDYPKVKYINKQAPLAAELFKNEIEIEFDFRSIQRKILYRDRYFIPKLHPHTDAIQNNIELKTRKLSVESLRQILELNNVDITAEITSKIKEILKTAKLKEGLRRRIIQNIQLRDQPILDPEQITIYRSKYSSNLIISGSAGTGKTTVILNRISLATKPENLSEEEREGITKQGLELLSTKKDNWILYTPTELLKNYLKEAFNREGIPAPEGRIKVWHDERIELGKNVLKFLIVGDKGNFRITSKNIFKKKSNPEIQLYTDEFKKYYLKSIEEKLYKNLAEIETFDKITLFPGRLRSIKNYYESMKELDYQKKITSLIGRLNSEREYYNQIRGQSNDNIDDLVDKILREKIGILDKIVPLLQEQIPEELDGEIEEEQIDQEELKIPEVQITNEDILRAHQKLKNAIAQYAERKIKKQSISVKSTNWQIIDLIKDILEKYSEKIEIIGTHRLSLRLTNQLTAGYIRNFIQLIPSYYAQFRNKIFRDENQSYFEVELLQEIKDKKYISEIEADILIFNILGNTREYYNKNLKQLADGTNSDVTGIIKEFYKNIINVDEATDFSSVTLGCMYYLCNPFIKSFTLAGDPMQRVTLEGIQNWNDLDYLVIEFQLKHLHKVYRQSYKLLTMAKHLYKQFVGEPQFDSAFPPDENEPAPLIFKSSDKEEFKKWLVNRIIEIYRITEDKASIALFVADDTLIDPLGDLITESLADNSFEVERCKGGKILSNSSKIRIFSIEYIKGLEFEAVFYINIDEIFNLHPNLIDKYLYVGLTRAGSFLGITYTHEFPKPLECIKGLLEESDWNWLIE